ncbi:hypothetical protein BGZ73_000427 [Actinomortierella ambigua]|nr:hypothetical protein BGZ73_000427 [Actinomortierella ambigua]
MSLLSRSTRLMQAHTTMAKSLVSAAPARALSSTVVCSNKAAAATPQQKKKKDTLDDSTLTTIAQQKEYTTGLARLREHYHSTVQDDLMVLTYQHKFHPKAKIPEGVRIELRGHKHLRPNPKAPSPRNVPELVKIDVHCMMKEALTSKYNLLSGFMAMQSITGEMPEIIFAKKGVHPWKLRAGNPIGCKVTLRGDKMYQFLDKLVEIVLPRMKEWPGLPEGAGDDTGNVGMGFPPSALSLFPEIEANFDMYPRMTGFDVTFTTTAATNLDARLLMSGFNLPFQQKNRSPPAVVKTEAATPGAGSA